MHGYFCFEESHQAAIEFEKKSITRQAPTLEHTTSKKESEKKEEKLVFWVLQSSTT